MDQDYGKYDKTIHIFLFIMSKLELLNTIIPGLNG